MTPKNLLHLRANGSLPVKNKTKPKTYFKNSTMNSSVNFHNVMNCEFCNHPVKSHTALCSNCGRFGRTIPEYIRFHQFDIPEQRVNDFNWLKRNAHFRNSKHPAYPRLVEMLKET